jgi:hypothetical protein
MMMHGLTNPKFIDQLFHLNYSKVEYLRELLAWQSVLKYDNLLLCLASLSFHEFALLDFNQLKLIIWKQLEFMVHPCHYVKQLYLGSYADSLSVCQSLSISNL